VEKSYSDRYIETDVLPQQNDMVVMTEVLEHLQFEPIPTIKKIYDSLNNDGILILSTPDVKTYGKSFYNKRGIENYKDIISYQKENPSWLDTHYYTYTIDEVKELLEQAGFKIEYLKIKNKHIYCKAVK